MQKILLTMTALGGLCVASAAGAADLTSYNSGSYNAMTYGAPVSDWSGFYAGGNVGYGWGKATTSLAAPYDTLNTAGFNGGVQAGYNFQAGELVFGVEADAQLSNIYYSQTIGANTTKVGVDYFGTLRGRVGYSFDAFMPYATAGIAAGRGTAANTNGGVTTTNSQTHVGWALGAGVEVAVTDQVTAKAEYLYTNLGSQTYSAGFPGGGGTTNLDFGTIRVGVNYKF